MKSDNIINDPRTVYSLAMVVILYEFFRSEYLTGEEPLILIIKSVLLILMGSQLIFLLLSGLSLAEYKDEHKENLLEAANLSYAAGFQSSLVFFMIGLVNIMVYQLFKSNGIPFNPLGKITYFVISLLIAFGVWRIRKEYFDIRPKTNFWVKRIIGLWIFIIIVVLIDIG